MYLLVVFIFFAINAWDLRFLRLVLGLSLKNNRISGRIRQLVISLFTLVPGLSYEEHNCVVLDCRSQTFTQRPWRYL